MRFAVTLRIIMMTLTAYFFSFVLHQLAVYFWSDHTHKSNSVEIAVAAPLSLPAR